MFKDLVGGRISALHPHDVHIATEGLFADISKLFARRSKNNAKNPEKRSGVESLLHEVEKQIRATYANKEWVDKQHFVTKPIRVYGALNKLVDPYTGQIPTNLQVRIQSDIEKMLKITAESYAILEDISKHVVAAAEAAKREKIPEDAIKKFKDAMASVKVPDQKIADNFNRELSMVLGHRHADGNVVVFPLTEETLPKMAQFLLKEMGEIKGKLMIAEFDDDVEDILGRNHPALTQSGDHAVGFLSTFDNHGVPNHAVLHELTMVCQRCHTMTKDILLGVETLMYQSLV